MATEIAVTSQKKLFGFMDETGLLHTPATDRIFALGLLKLECSSRFHREIINFKNRKRFHGEFKFVEVSDKNWRLYGYFLDIFFNILGGSFYALVFDKQYLDINKFFKGNHEKAYNSFVAKLIALGLDKSEYITILADDVSTPKSDNFEKQVKYKVKERLKRNALFGIIRVESHAVSEIQMTDVLIGLIGYAFKLKYHLIKKIDRGKLRLLKKLQTDLRIDFLSEGVDKKIRGGGKFFVKEFSYKNDRALESTGNKPDTTHPVKK